METSISDIQKFTRCSRGWDLTSHNRQNLERKQAMPHMAFYVGSLVHRILEVQARLKARPPVDILIADSMYELEQEYRQLVGTGWSSIEREEIEKHSDLVKDMMERYFHTYGEINPLPGNLEYVSAEVTFQVRIPGTYNYLKGTIDGIARNKKTGAIWIVEHKTYKDRSAKLEDLRINYQMLAYSYAAQKLLGYPVAGVIYDGLCKKSPKKPALLKSGNGLSKAWIATTGYTYRQAIAEHGFNEEDYTEILAKIDAHELREEGGFFTRHKLRYPQQQLDQFEDEIRIITRSMASKHVKIYPVVPWTGCWDCSVQDLCTGISTRSDISYLIENNYQQSQGYETTRKKAIRKLEIKE